MLNDVSLDYKLDWLRLSRQPSNNMPASDGGEPRDMPAAPAGPTCKIERTARETPQTIWMMVDGSGSMVELLDDKSRWLALREALLDNTAGVVKALALYDGPLLAAARPYHCPTAACSCRARPRRQRARA